MPAMGAGGAAVAEAAVAIMQAPVSCQWNVLLPADVCLWRHTSLGLQTGSQVHVQGIRFSMLGWLCSAFARSRQHPAMETLSGA